MRKWTWVLGGIAGSALAAIGLEAWRERRLDRPGYRVQRRDGAIEIRDYDAIVVARTDPVTTDHDEAMSFGFRALANYIFAKERPGEKLAMTAPVFSERVDGDRWRLRFVMPAGRTLADLPPPQPGVELEDIPPRRMAAIRFGGLGGARAMADKEAKLRQWLSAQGLAIAGPPIEARYNSPMVLPPLRVNELLIPPA